MKLKLIIDIDQDTLASDVQSFLASIRFVLRGMFPEAKLRVSVEQEPKAPRCPQATRESTPPGPN